MVIETHYGIRYTCDKTTQGTDYTGSHIIDYGTDRAAAEANFHGRLRPYREELVQRKVTYSSWRPASTQQLGNVAAGC